MVVQMTLETMLDRIVTPIGEVIVAGALAALTLVVLDLGQILALQLILGSERLGGQAMGWLGRTARAQLLWGFASVVAIEVIVIQPWFLVPGIPLFVLGYFEIRARFVAERRARLLATLVEVSHAVGASLDPNEVFRNVYRQVVAVMDADNFFVATLGPDGSTVRYRFLVDGGRELDPVERAKEGTLVGAAIEHGPLLLKEVERDARRLGLAISEKTELVDVTKLVAESVVDLLKPAVAAVYIDKGGDTLDLAFTTGKATSDVLALPKTSPVISRVLDAGVPIAFSRRAD